VNRMAFQQVPPEEVEARAFDELGRTLTTRDDVRHLVDYKVRVALMRNYETDAVKSLINLTADDFGVAVIRSDLTSLRQDEKEFSDWLHAEPMHDTSPAEEQQIEQALEQQTAGEQAPEEQSAPNDQGESAAGNVEETKTPSEEVPA